MKRLALAIVFVLGFVPPAWADFSDGVAAYNRGDYATASREMKPLAEQGFAKAQYNLGVMYDKGGGGACHRIMLRRSAGIARPPSRVSPKHSTTSASCTT